VTAPPPPPLRASPSFPFETFFFFPETRIPQGSYPLPLFLFSCNSAFLCPLSLSNSPRASGQVRKPFFPPCGSLPFLIFPPRVSFVSILGVGTEGKPPSPLVTPGIFPCWLHPPPPDNVSPNIDPARRVFLVPFTPHWRLDARARRVLSLFFLLDQVIFFFGGPTQFAFFPAALFSSSPLHQLKRS